MHAFQIIGALNQIRFPRSLFAARKTFTLRGLQSPGHRLHRGGIIRWRAGVRPALVPARVVFASAGRQERGQLAVGCFFNIIFAVVPIVGDDIFWVP